MPWNAPPPVSAGDVASATNYNTYLKDNLLYLFSRPAATIQRDNGASYTTTSTSFVDIDSTNLTITLTVAGSAVLLHFAAMTPGTNAVGYINGTASFDFAVDGVRVTSAASDGLVAPAATGSAGINYAPVNMTALVTGLTPGAHTFRVQWKVIAGTTAVLYAGNGTPGQDFIPIFTALEIG